MTATHTLLGENKREHHYTVSVNSLSTRAYCKIRGRLSLDCCKNKCANAGILSLISIRFCQCSTPLGCSQKRFYTGRLLPRSNPITLYSTLLTEKVPGPLVYLLLINGTPVTGITSSELLIPLIIS